MTTVDKLAAIKPADLPAPRQAAIEIMHACSQADVSHNELSRLAGSDPVLTAELLRVVNSSYFGLSRQVDSLGRAVTVLGQRALRSLVLCVAVRDALQREQLPGLDAAALWEEALRRAVAARLLGEQQGLDRDEAFTAGLLQDFGFLVLLHLNPEVTDASELLELNPEQRRDQEQVRFGLSHDQVMRVLAESWSLPEAMSAALANHHQCDGQADTDKLGRVLKCSDWLAALYGAKEKGAILEQAREMLSGEFGFDQAAADQLLATLPTQVDAAAAALGLHIAPQADFEQILSQANLALAQQNLTYQELTWQLEQTLKERDRLADELNRELELAREIQNSLLPSEMPTDFPIAGINIPARELSGDFYDYFQLADGRIYFSLGDVAGKGANAALLMAKTASLFRCLGKEIHDPADLLSRVNAELCETALRGLFVSLIGGVFDPVARHIELVNAGHLPAIKIGPNCKPESYAASTPPLGIVPDMEFKKSCIDLGESSLYLFSDGIIEQRDQAGEELGVQGLFRLIAKVEQSAPRERLNAIIAKLTSEQATPRDDMSLLVVDGANGHA